MAEIKFTDQALKDLEEISSYIGNESQHYASLQMQKIFQRAEILETFPLIGRIVPELKVKLVREIIEGYYRIIYRVAGKEEIHRLTTPLKQTPFSKSIENTVKKIELVFS